MRRVARLWQRLAGPHFSGRTPLPGDWCVGSLALYSVARVPLTAIIGIVAMWNIPDCVPGMYGIGIDVELVAVLRVDPLLHLHLLRRDGVPLGQRRS